MGNADNITGWITLILGLYSVAAGLGEFLRPGFWARMVKEVQASSALQFLTGVFTLVVGSTIYLVNPWNPSDLLSILVTVIGGWVMIEGLLILAVGDWFMGFAGRMMGGTSRIWGGIAILLGAGVIIAGLVRLQL